MQQLAVGIDKVAQLVRHPVGKCGYDRSRKAMTDEYHVVQVFKPEDLRNILDESLQRRPRSQQMRSFPEPSQGRRVDQMSERAQAGGNIFPAPTSEKAP